MMAKLEELTTGDALVRLLLEVDGLVVALHDVPFAENLAARRVGAREGPTKMHTVIVRHHAVVARK